jgi:hypothetical protein
VATLTTTKKSVTLREDIAAEAEARSRTIGFSAYTNQALEEKLRFDKLAEIQRKYELENGPVDNVLISEVYSDIARARRELADG